MSSESHVMPSQSLPEYKLTIEEQPEEHFRFRYKVDQLHTHGVIYANNSIRNNRYPTIKLVAPTPNDEYFATVSLYHDDVNGQKVLSPHLLKEKAKKKDETCAPVCRLMKECKENEYILELDGCYIECTKKGDDTEISLSRQDQELEKIWPDTPRKCRSIKGNNPRYVYLGFNAFKKGADNKYIHVCGPVYSHKVAHQSCAFGILKLCNNYVNHSRGDEITIVLTGPPPEKKTFKVEIYEIDRETNDKIWRVEVKPTFVNKEVICFNVPKYEGTLANQKEIKEVKCYVGILGKICSFYYEFTPDMEGNEIPNKRCRFEDIPLEYNMRIPNNLMDFELSLHNAELGVNAIRLPQFGTNSTYGLGNFQADPRREYRVQYDYAVTEGFNRFNLSNAPKHKQMLSGDQYLNAFERILNEAYISNKSLLNEINRLNNDYSTQHKKGNTIFHALIECNFPKFLTLYEKLLPLKPVHSLLCRAVNNNGEHLLHYACILNKAAYIGPLLKLNLKLKLKDGFGKTALHIAIEKQHNTCIEKFVEILCRSDEYPSLNDDVKELFDTHDRQGFTVMHLAVTNNLKDLLEEMLKFCKKCEINPNLIQTLGYGDTIAHLAVQKELSGLSKLINKYVPDARFCGNYAGITATDLELEDSDQIE